MDDRICESGDLSELGITVQSTTAAAEPLDNLHMYAAEGAQLALPLLCRLRTAKARNWF